MVIFDIKMPKMDGLELLRRVRENSLVELIVIVALYFALTIAIGLYASRRVKSSAS